MKIQLRKRIRTILEENPDGGTATEIGQMVANLYNTNNQDTRQVAAICSHDPLIAKSGTFCGANTYVLKKHLL
jgi:hypothetical protein|tara:strand:+ start:452 stop:670 length:219 start_codon:yes stop_codon:yes gene_type:complete